MNNLSGQGPPVQPTASCWSPTEHGAVNKQVANLLRLMRSTSIFWSVVILVFLGVITLSTFLEHPQLLLEPRGWGILILAVTMAAWYHFGSLWMMYGDRKTYHARRDNGELPRILWRGFAYWASMLAIVAALSVLNNNFVWLFWAVYGLNFVIFPFPRVFITLVPTIVVIIVANGWLPASTTPVGMLQFAGELCGLTIYSVIAYLPYMLIRARFHREQVFADLERSHQALELAHTRLELAHRQLAEASAREREIAVLRERERLARDMHDTLGHALVLANVKLEAALRLRSIDPARADHEITVTQQVLRDSMADLRTSLASLRSSPPREPLGEVLVRLANEAAARATWEVYSDVAACVPLDARTYEALLRVGSEAITNAERHAGAHSLRLQLESSARKDSVVLRVSDDGIGIFSSFLSAAPTGDVATTKAAGEDGDAVATLTIPVEAASPDGHYGITGMRERIMALGGQLIIQPLHGTTGTVIEAHLPVSELCESEIR